MSSHSQPYDPATVRLAAAQQAQQTTASILANQLPKFKGELFKDIQGTLAKVDGQVATLSAQFLKFDQSLFKWDEKGLTFAGRPIGPGKKWSLENAVYGRSDRREKEEKAEKDAAEAKAAAATRQRERERVKKFEDELNRQVRAARTGAHQAQEDARRAQQDSRRADNLLRSADQSARLAARSATQASRSLAALEARVDDLEARI
ncbi:hypothetical protein ABZX30_29275 [Streptomyces sp. NPDC004542]|uniref:hypothetical protein n=1 Tax=Streptomyces sp. NPDC004542 TaxID=3154281 RepID=UPI0033BE694E